MSQFSIGQNVRIREWDDMRRSFSEDENGDITIDDEGMFFNQQMKKLCGMEFVITGIFTNSCGAEEVEGLDTFWHITTSMIEDMEEEEICPTDEINDFLGQIKIS